MSVWLSPSESQPSLCGTEGTLISVSVNVEPRYLEGLLDALAQLAFPINPQIYHEAVIQYVYPDGRVEEEPTTIVEFPAYEARLNEVRAVLELYGFPPGCLHVAAMLEDIHSDGGEEAAPPGAAYRSRVLRKHAAVCGVA